jgi:copper chaperone CopZ
MSGHSNATYTVGGLSCGHCESAVRDEVEKVDGVDAVEVELASKRVTVHGDFQEGDVRAAISKAGYEAAP